MINDKKYTSWLAAILRKECPEWLGSDDSEDENILWRTGIDHGVFALCHQAISSCDSEFKLPLILREKIKKYALLEAATEMLIKEELDNVLSIFTDNQIKVLLIKGTPLAYSIYPEPYLRNRCDTDLLFPDRDEAERAAKLLLEHGYIRPLAKIGGDASYEFICYKPGKLGITHYLDMHWQINNNWVLARNLTYNELAEAAIPVPLLSPLAQTLSLPHALILCCIHRLAHKPLGEADRLIWLYDIHLICEKLNKAEWEQFTNLTIEKELCDICLDELGQTQSAFGTTIPKELNNRLREYATREEFNRNIGNNQVSMAVANFRALPNWKTKGLFLKEHLFPDTNYMLNKYKTRNRLLLPFLFIGRLVQGAWKIAT